MRSVLIAMVLAASSTATSAQWYPDSDPRSSNYQQYLQQQRDEFNKRQRDEEARNKQHAEEMYGQTPSSPSGGNSASTGAGGTDFRALGKEMLRLPPLPVERNVLLGSWRLEGSTQQSDARQSRIAELGITGKGALKARRPAGIYFEYRIRTAGLRHVIRARHYLYAYHLFERRCGRLGGKTDRVPQPNQAGHRGHPRR